MNKLIITTAAALCVCVSAFAAENVTNDVPPVAAGAVRKATKSTELTTRDLNDAARCGTTVEQWKTMTKKARKEARQAAKAKALGMTVAEMKAANNRKAAEKAGCDPEKWAKMSVKERCAFRKQAKENVQAQAAAQTE